MDLGKFDLLEGRLNILLEKMTSLERTNEDLKTKLATCENALEQMAEVEKENEGLKSDLTACQENLSKAETQINSLEDERQIILNKIEAMLGRLE